MSGLNLSIQAGVSPSGTPLPSSAQSLLQFCAQYLRIAGAGAFNGINFGSNTPPPQNQSLPWFKTDVLGNPIGLFSWNGTAWVTTPTIIANGPTSGRPTGASEGSSYYDTTIRTVLIWNAGQGAWTTLAGSIGDVKEVTAATIAAALLANPGWQQHTASNGCVIGGAADVANAPATAHPQGQLIGEEAHAIAVSEMPAHTHTEAYSTYSGAFQNGTQPGGVFPAVTPGALTLPNPSTGSAGGGSPANIIQPTMYLFRLYKAF